MGKNSACQDGGRLAEKLKSEYRDRVKCAGASPASERVRRTSDDSFFGDDVRRSRNNSFYESEKRRSSKTQRFSKIKRFFGADEEPENEIRVERKKIPAGFLLALAFCTVMVMLVIMSVSQIYQTTREISKLERDVVSLKENIDDLELKLDEKNDIRLIEQMATASLGMVKEDSLQRKYISLSDGERVDVIEVSASADAAGEQGMGAMLSSFFAAIGDLFGYSK